MVLRRMKNRIPNSKLRKLAIGIFHSAIQYGITVYGIAKLEPEDNFPNTTKSLQIIANNMMRVIKTVKSIIRQWGTEKLCQKLQFFSINQFIIKSKLLEILKTFKIECYPLHELVTESSNKHIAKSNVIKRSNVNNTLRPNPGNKLTTNSLLGKSIYLRNQSSNDFKNTISYYKAKRLAKKRALSYSNK